MQYIVEHWIVDNPPQLVETYGPFSESAALRTEALLNGADDYTHESSMFTWFAVAVPQRTQQDVFWR